MTLISSTTLGNNEDQAILGLGEIFHVNKTMSSYTINWDYQTPSLTIFFLILLVLWA